MSPRPVRVWPVGDYPTDCMDLVNEEGDVVITVSAGVNEDESKVLIDDDFIHILVEGARVTKRAVKRELSKLSRAMNVKWIHKDSKKKVRKEQDGFRN